MPLGQTKAKLDYFMDGCVDTLHVMECEYLFVKTFRHYPLVGAISKHLVLWNNLAFYTVIFSLLLGNYS